ncbi:MAG: endonuclease/exonuclease/phosphatase family protein [Pseudomonadota bacterium]
MLSNPRFRHSPIALAIFALTAAARADMINEFQPNPNGGDPSVVPVELIGTPGASFSGWLLSIESDLGDPGVVDRASEVSGTYDSEGLLVVNIPDLENPSFTLVLTDAFTGSVGGTDIDADNDGVLDDTSSFGTVLDAIGTSDTTGEPVYGSGLGFIDFPFTGDEPQLMFRDGGTGEWYAINDPDNGVAIDAAGNAQLLEDFGPDAAPGGNFGDVNPELGAEDPILPVEPECGLSALTPVYAIQGAGHVSPLVLPLATTTADFFAGLPDTGSIAGDAVSTSGIVTAVDSNGFYLQDPDGDADDSTSDGIFVFTGSAPSVDVGDEVEVNGAAAEFFPGSTQSRNLPTSQVAADTVIVCSSDNALPAPVIIGSSGRVPPDQSIDDDAFALFDPAADGIDFFESLEGMLVTAEDVLAVTGTNRFGEIFGVVNQGVGASGLSSRKTLNIAPDDFNPEKVQIDEDSGVYDFSFPSVDAGDLLGDVTGVVSYGFGNFEILPTADFTANILDAGLVGETGTLVPGFSTLSVASYNVLNLDPNDADGDADVADGRFTAVAEHIVTNLNTPDIIGLQEVQDNSGSDNDGTTAADVTLQTLVDAIALAGGPSYSFIDNTFIGDGLSGGQPGGNIRTAFLYNSERVGLVDGSVRTISGQGPGEAFEGARLPLAAVFEFNHRDVQVIVNHFSSKGGSAPILGIAQDFTSRQEDVSVNGSLDERQLQSGAVQGFVSDLLVSDPNANIVVLGDFNEFEFISPVTGLEAAGLVNQTFDLAPEERYSFAFQGNSQSLDHILLSASLDASAAFEVVRVNSEFAASPSRASDHDPLVAALELPFLTPTSVKDCRRGGWRDLYRANGTEFRNFRQCRRYVFFLFLFGQL